MNSIPQKLNFVVRVLTWWVSNVRRHPLVFVILSTLVTGLAFQYTREHLGINTDTADMFSEKLTWRQTESDYERAFPQYSNALTVVVEGDTPDLADRASRLLAKELSSQSELIEWVYRPGGGPFFEKNALLFLDADELEDLGDNLAEIQPFLGKLSDDPSVAGLFSLLSSALDELQEGADIELAPFFEHVSEAVEAVLAGRFHQLSWQELMLGRDAKRSEKWRFITVRPKLDFTELFPAEDAIDKVREIASRLDLNPEHGVRIRITGSLAMEYEELKSVSDGIGISGLLSLFLVGAVLFFGVRSLRLVAASLITLVIGLLWTAAFAAYAIGHLNLISIAFAVLYIGLGIDYAIHFCLRYKELIRQGTAHADALDQTTQDVGVALCLCAITTGIGFFAFVPTEFAGVSELGLISGTGTFIGLFASLTVLPALLSLMPLPHKGAIPGKQTGNNAAAPLSDAIAQIPYRYPKGVLGSTVLLSLGALILLPQVRFDHNPLNLRDPKTESVATFRDLLNDSDTSPWALAIVAPNRSAGESLKARLKPLKTVDTIVTLNDFIPSEQEEKLFLIEELQILLGADVTTIDSVKTHPPEAYKAAIETFNDDLASFLSAQPTSNLAVAGVRLQSALERLRERLDDATPTTETLLTNLQYSLIGALPLQLDTLAKALGAEEVRPDTLPKSLSDRWVTNDGRYRIQVYPREDVNDNAALNRFVSDVDRVTPNATGAPVVNLKSGNAVVRSFQQAFICALVAVGLLLWLILRRVGDTVLVLVPLAIAGLLALAIIALFDIPFNYANIIALPLLLGIGVDNGVHMVERMRLAPPISGNLLKTSTARAVIISALTTIFSFGTLILSSHKGTSTMGQVLTIGLGTTLICTLIILPTLLARSQGQAKSRAAILTDQTKTDESEIDAG